MFVFDRYQTEEISHTLIGTNPQSLREVSSSKTPLLQRRSSSFCPGCTIRRKIIFPSFENRAVLDLELLRFFGSDRRTSGFSHSVPLGDYMNSFRKAHGRLRSFAGVKRPWLKNPNWIGKEEPHGRNRLERLLRPTFYYMERNTRNSQDTPLTSCLKVLTSKFALHPQCHAKSLQARDINMMAAVVIDDTSLE